MNRITLVPEALADPAVEVFEGVDLTPEDLKALALAKIRIDRDGWEVTTTSTALYLALKQEGD